MGFLSKLFDSFLGGGDEPQVEKPDLPDYASYWKQYQGWINNINDRNKGELADVRARLSAAGADPDQLMMQTEQLESQRKSDIAQLSDGPTKRFLDEAFDIATGKKANPYKTQLPGMEMEEYQSGTSGGEGGSNDPIYSTRPKATVAGSMEEYFTKFFGTATPDAPDANTEAAKRAKMAAGGAASGDAAPGGGPETDPNATTISTVFGVNDDAFWR